MLFECYLWDLLYKYTCPYLYKRIIYVQVASWGGDLLDRGIITMSMAPRDSHEAQVQFSLEQGIPAMLCIISTQQLPYPSNAFDMASYP